MPTPNKHQRREGTPCEKQKRKLPGKSPSSKKKKRRKNSDKVVFWGFEPPHCLQKCENDSVQEEEDKYLQRLIICRKKTYESTNKGHSLWVNYKTVHCRNFHKESNYPQLKVEDGKLVSADSGGSLLSKKNLLKYELTKEQYSNRNRLNSNRKKNLKSTFFTKLFTHIRVSVSTYRIFKINTDCSLHFSS